jgi:hypothetical protein
MKTLIFFSPLLLLLIAASAEAFDGHDCLAQSKGMNQQESASYLNSCLAKVASPSNVLEVKLNSKRLQCAQNAKNKNLGNVEAASYLSSCINKNEAAETMAKFKKTIPNGFSTALNSVQ